MKESYLDGNGRIDFLGAAGLPGKTGLLKWVTTSFPILPGAVFVKSSLAVFSFVVAV
ncbi:MAG: hypothetical protein KAT81_02800 [Syntrophobacterales bacterium]|nr:hypothetical protein [Syntrophobacterales bacterium]